MPDNLFYAEEVVRVYFDVGDFEKAMKKVMETKTAAENENLQEVFKRIYDSGGNKND